MEYCSAGMGLAPKMIRVMFSISFTGKASGEGFPAAKGMMPGSAVFFRISRMALGWREAIRSLMG